MLGRRAKSLQLGCYSEVHQLRELVGKFVQRPADQSGGLWWDGIDPALTTHRPWISTELGQHPLFVGIVEKWLEDNEEVQGFIDNFEAKTTIFNNPGSSNPVFSEESAFMILDFGKVRCLEKFQAPFYRLTTWFAGSRQVS